MKLTVELEIVHLSSVASSMMKVTGLPDGPPVALTVYVSPITLGWLGGELNVIVCAPWPTVNACCAWGAGSYSASPAWVASMVHVPTCWKLTMEPEVLPTSVQTDLLASSIVRTTWLPDAPPSAVTV